MPWGLLFFVIFVFFLWSNLSIEYNTTLKDIIDAMLSMRAESVASDFKTTVYIVGLIFVFFFLSGKGWLADKAKAVVKGIGSIEKHLEKISEIAKNKSS